MKTVTEAEVQADLAKVLDTSQHERVVITRNGKPNAIVVGLADYDAEDIELANSADFWRMIEDRRSGPSVPLAEVKARLVQREANGSSSNE